MKRPRRVCAVIVTFNNPRMLGDLLEDLKRQSLKPWRIIVADNSDRCGADDLTGAAQGVTCVSMGVNEGSAGGFHEGLRMALEGADAILTLDDDVRMPADALERLVDGLEELDGREARVGAVRAVGPNHPDAGPTSIPCFAWRGTLMKTEAVRQAGFPRKDYFLYADDTEYALRMAEAGYRFFWIPGSLIEERRRDDKQRLSILGREVTCYAEAYRFYYAVRNSIHAYREHRRWGELWHTLVYAAKMFLLLSLVRTGERGNRARAIREGVMDGFRSKLGKRAAYLPAQPAPGTEWRQAEGCR